MTRDGFKPRLVAVIGGSGSGKSWLVTRLQSLFPEQSATVSLDSFYQDRSHVPSGLRECLNYDHPKAIDWSAAEKFFTAWREGEPAWLPEYDFATHTRRQGRWCMPRPLLLADGLWLLWRPELRRLFDLTVYVDCPEDVRLARRLARDTASRGRTPDSIREQFQKWVAPMHGRFVEPQKKWADVILAQPVGKREVEWLGDHVLNLLASARSSAPWAEPVQRLAFKAQLLEKPL
jgi:uridine kinase